MCDGLTYPELFGGITNDTALQAADRRAAEKFTNTPWCSGLADLRDAPTEAESSRDHLHCRGGYRRPSCGLNAIKPHREKKTHTHSVVTTPIVLPGVPRTGGVRGLQSKSALSFLE